VAGDHRRGAESAAEACMAGPDQSAHGSESGHHGGNPGEVFADSAYRGAHFYNAIRGRRRHSPDRRERRVGKR
jgi:hypothetical protein